MTATSTDFVWHRRESQTRNNNQHSPRRCLSRNIRFLSKESRLHPSPCMEMAHTCACMSKMETSYICITTPSQSPNSLHIWNSCQEESQHLASLSYRS